MSDEKEKILGIDPGTRLTGYGIIECVGGKFHAIDYGCIKPPPSLELSDRYLIIFEAVEALVLKWKPTAVAIEGQFVHKNARIALKLGMACCAALLAAKKNGIEVVEYSPKTAKKAVTGRGSASKLQVQGMIQRLLSLSEIPEPEDAADALCLALCHGQRQQHKVII